MRPKTRGRPFPKGKSGNPGGRPVHSDCFSACLREVASQPAGGGLTHLQKLARVLFRRAEAGDVRAAALIADRLEGKPGQRIELAQGRGEVKDLVLVVRNPDGTEESHSLTGAAGEPQTGGPEAIH